MRTEINSYYPLTVALGTEKYDPKIGEFLKQNTEFRMKSISSQRPIEYLKVIEG